MKITVADIAKAAGVSPGTVSNALNNRKGSLSEEKREHILKIAEELGYFRKNKRTGILRFVVFSRSAHIVGDTPFFSELIRGIETECSQQGYQLIINHLNADDKTSDFKQFDDASSCDGLILLGTEMNLDDLTQCCKIQLPYVIVDTAFNFPNCDFIAINNTDGVYEIVTRLIWSGHEMIGLINSAYQINNFRERKIGFLQAIQDSNLYFMPECEALVEPDIDGSYHDMLDYLKLYMESGMELPTAFFAVNDNIALGALRAFHELNLDISIAGFDDIPACSVSSPTLTTVQVDKQYIGKTAVTRLVEKITQNDHQVQKILIGTKIISRDSIHSITK